MSPEERLLAMYLAWAESKGWRTSGNTVTVTVTIKRGD